MPIKVTKTKQRTIARSETPHAGERSDGRLPTWPIESWLQFQADLFSAAEPALTSWLARRGEAACSALETMARLTVSRDLGEALAAQNEWLDGVLARINLDLHGMIEQAQAVTRCTARATQDAAATTTQAAVRGSEWLVSRGEAEEKHPAAETRAPVEANAPAADALWHSR